MTRQALLKKLIVTTFLVSASSGWAFAQDINAVGERLKDVIGKQGMTISWTGATGDASEMVLQGVKVGVAGKPGEFAVGTLTLSDITEQNGGYTIGSVTVPDYKITEDAATIAVSGRRNDRPSAECAGLDRSAGKSDDV